MIQDTYAHQKYGHTVTGISMEMEPSPLPELTPEVIQTYTSFVNQEIVLVDRPESQSVQG